MVFTCAASHPVLQPTFLRLRIQPSGAFKLFLAVEVCDPAVKVFAESMLGVRSISGVAVSSMMPLGLKRASMSKASSVRLLWASGFATARWHAQTEVGHVCRKACQRRVAQALAPQVFRYSGKRQRRTAKCVYGLEKNLYAVEHTPLVGRVLLVSFGAECCHCCGMRSCQ